MLKVGHCLSTNQSLTSNCLLLWWSSASEEHRASALSSRRGSHDDRSLAIPLTCLTNQLRRSQPFHPLHTLVTTYQDTHYIANSHAKIFPPDLYLGSRGTLTRGHAIHKRWQTAHTSEAKKRREKMRKMLSVSNLLFAAILTVAKQS